MFDELFEKAYAEKIKSFKRSKNLTFKKGVTGGSKVVGDAIYGKKFSHLHARCVVGKLMLSRSKVIKKVIL